MMASQLRYSQSHDMRAVAAIQSGQLIEEPLRFSVDTHIDAVLFAGAFTSGQHTDSVAHTRNPSQGCL